MSAIKTISCKYVIQRIFSNHSINNGNWENDALDWVGQAMRFIGKSVGFDRKILCNAEVIDHKVCYPCGMEGLIAVVHNGFTLPLGTDLSGIGICCTKKDLELLQSIDDLSTLSGYQDQLNTLQGMYAKTPTQELADKINYVSGLILALEISMSTFSVYSKGRISNSSAYYNTKLDVIQTSFECGFVDIIYTAFKVCEEGYLQIPDEEFYIKAVEFYILLILVQKGYQHPIFNWDQLEAMFFGGIYNGRNYGGGLRAQACNSLRMPSIDNMERVTRMMERVIMDRNLYNVQFQGGEQRTGLLF